MVQIFVMNILDINIVQLQFETQFQLMMSWFDPRLRKDPSRAFS
jgi:hypothetical protein